MKDVVKNGSRESKAVQRKTRNGREGGIAGYCAVAFVFVSLVGVVLCLTVFFKVKNVEVNGLTLYREDQIVGVGGVVNNSNLVRTDTKLIEQRLKDNLVFIETAEVEKKYPSTLIINVTEAVKAADIMLDNGKFCTVSTSGRVLELSNAAQTGDIPVVKGFELSTEKAGGELESKDKNKLRIYNEIMRIINAIDFEKIVQIDLSNRSGITMVYDNRISLELGSSVDLDYKLNYFKAVIDNKLTGGFKGRLVYNGADSGISAIPDGADTKNDYSKDDQDDQNDQNDQPDDKTQKTDNADDANAANNGDANTNPANNANNANNADNANNANNANNADNANNGQIPDGVENYGYMQNQQNQQNQQGGNNADNGGIAGYDNNAGTNYNNGGNDYNNGGNDWNYDPNADGNNYQFYYQP